MLNLFSLKDGKREADSGGNRPNQKRGTAAQIRITKGTVFLIEEIVPSS